MSVTAFCNYRLVIKSLSLLLFVFLWLSTFLSCRDASALTIPEKLVYDLTWSEDSDVQQKWRGFIDTRTNLPKRTERYRKKDNEQSFVLTTITKIEYPSDAELSSVLMANGVD